MRCRTTNPSLIFSILLIVVGTLFFLDNIGVLAIGEVWRFWPLGLIVGGISKFCWQENMSGRIWGSFLVFCGVFWLGDNLHLFKVSAGTIWPLTLITLGVMALVRNLEVPKPAAFADSWSETRFRQFLLFSGIKRRMETPNFEGADIVCLFGGVDLNLRKCGISGPGNQAVVNVAITFGGVDIKIPEGWRVMNNCVAVFGACEDKTLVPRPETGVQSPILIITGHAIFGAVNIEN